MKLSSSVQLGGQCIYEETIGVSGSISGISEGGRATGFFAKSVD